MTKHQSHSGSTKLSDPCANLVMAMLSVNSFTLEKTFEISENLRANGLFDLNNLLNWDVESIFRKLLASGYKRGGMNGIFAERLKSLGELAADILSNERVLLDGSKDDITNLLRPVKGVGPVVLRNYMLLRGE